MADEKQSRGADRAATWLRDNPEVRERALSATGINTLDVLLDEAVLLKPERLVDLLEEVVRTAQDAYAPAEVIEELNDALVRMRDGIAQLSNNEYVLSTLAELQGLRTLEEIEPVLAEAIEQAPDEASKQRLQDGLDAVREVEVDGSTPQQMGGCMGCCVTACVICGGGCGACCVIGCAACW